MHKFYLKYKAHLKCCKHSEGAKYQLFGMTFKILHDVSLTYIFSLTTHNCLVGILCLSWAELWVGIDYDPYPPTSVPLLYCSPNGVLCPPQNFHAISSTTSNPWLFTNPWLLLLQCGLMSLSLLKPYGTLLILSCFTLFLIYLLLLYWNHEPFANFHWIARFLNSALYTLQVKCIGWFKFYISKGE